MHWVKRGPEPEGLDRVRSQYTPRWVKYYRDGEGTKPSDTQWRKFRDNLSESFFGMCGYCENECKGEVDHFRPKSRFPERVYQWSSWVLACHDCNHMKGEKWPADGYVDPCARSRSERPENYFDFDIETGEILTKAGLSASRKSKSWQMIDDLDLNGFHPVRMRRKWLEVLSEALSINSANEEKVRRFCNLVASRSTRLSSIARVWLSERGYAFDDT